MPDVNIEHFPIPLAPDEELARVAAVTDAVASALRCPEGRRVGCVRADRAGRMERAGVRAEIVGRAHLLRKRPDY